ncbi:hypothetical protein GTY86_27880 [Streptomyces sp. SID5770]|uniref:hypothetical protein n=1 Tax=Streptomyces sp. SID5770 TaxID=2690308 RepID=UPI00136D30BB|nr:hypothetical protein [Streptomyces sp. SID5770]MZE55029.1 hypothetical protein [Streptomyces sp. SID5770]
MRRFQYILTLQLPTRTGLAVQTWANTADVPPGTSRHTVYKEVIGQCTAGAPEWATANVIFWSLEPDDLEPAGVPSSTSASVPPQRRG